MHEFISASTLLFMLLNPFLLVVYLIDVFQKLSLTIFVRVIMRAGLISIAVFSLSTLLGEVIFKDILQARFASFQIFGGIIFLLIGLRFVFEGNAAIEALRGESQYIAGAIAMPLMIGPGTIGASILVGKRLGPLSAILAIGLTVVLCVAVMIALKWMHDVARTHNEPMVERYIEIAGRITALVVGTYALEMILQGAEGWLRAIR
ncbi:MAG: multiple antibiotic resistance protein [Desulfuromonadales bacterium]|jgi:small neutral amino acid transporter SnatA (MarC family)|nr:multiple antibiotic resistance protein [Desulfuromonadales bacterium]